MKILKDRPRLQKDPIPADGSFGVFGKIGVLAMQRQNYK